jgi:hypothetical protein
MGLQWMARKNPHPEAGSSCLHLNLVLYAACLSKSIDSETFLNQNFSSRNKH